MGLIFSMNIIFFGLTAMHLNRVKKDIQRRRMRDRIAPQETRAKMIWKMFLVMGIAWVLELITSVFKDEFILWLFADFYNFLHGLFVFFIFVCKRAVFWDIKMRVRGWIRRIRG